MDLALRLLDSSDGLAEPWPRGSTDGTPRGVDALGLEVGLLSRDGILLSVTQAWRAASTRPGLGSGTGPGDNYVTACEHTRGENHLGGAALVAGIRQVLSGERARFHYEHLADGPGGLRCHLFDVAAVSDRSACAVVRREDITERKRGELLLELECNVARVLAEAGDASTALRAAIEAICLAQGWDCGRYFRLDPVAAMLQFQESWGRPIAKVERFLERSRGVVFHLGAGLQGRVCRSGQPLWVVAGRSDASMAALPPETESDGALMFPVTWDVHTLGVLAFTGGVPVEPDDRMLLAIRNIGVQLGRHLQRQQEHEALRRSEVRSRRLAQLASDWTWEQDSAFRFTALTGSSGVGALLGNTLWEMSNLVVDDARWEAHRGQVLQRWSFNDFEFAATQPDGTTAHFSISGEPVYNEAGTFTGYWGTGTDLTRRGLQPQCACSQSRNTTP